MIILIGDKNFRGKDFEAELAELDATILRPRRKDEQGRGPHLAPIRQRIESIFQTCKDILTLEATAPAPSRTSASDCAPDSPRSPPPDAQPPTRAPQPLASSPTPHKSVAQLI